MTVENKNLNKNNYEEIIIPKKGPINFIIGSLTSFILFLTFYFISKNVVIYFTLHRPSNSSEIVQSISSSINTLIIGLFFLLTFCFGFIALGLFIVFIRSFFVKNHWITNIIYKNYHFHVSTWFRPLGSLIITWDDFVNIATNNLFWRRLVHT